MKNKKGFTLIELLGSIVILGIIALVVTPPIINQIKNAKKKVSASSVSYLYSAGESYIKENMNDYTMKQNSTICIKISSLVDNGNINEAYIKEHNIEATSGLKFTVGSDFKLIGDTSLYNSTCSTKLKVTISS